jgi:phospholipase C
MATRFFAGALILAQTCLVLTPDAGAEIKKINHIVVIVQENRTPDNLFHGLRHYLPSADIADTGLDSFGRTITLTPAPLAARFDVGHTHKAFVAMYDHGRMDGANLISRQPAAGTTCPAHPQYTFVNLSDVWPYTFLAINYGFANRMIQSNQGPSFPAHQFLLSGTSRPSPTSLFFAAASSRRSAG